MKSSIHFLTIALFVLLFTHAAPAYVNITGRTLKSGTTGCGGCHASQSTTVLVSINGPDVLAPGQTGNYTVTISGGGGSTVAVNIASSVGSLKTADNNLKLSGGELISNGKKRFSGNSYTYNFTFTAPTSGGSAVLYATGQSSMSAFNFAPNKTITISTSTAVYEPIPAHTTACSLAQNYPNPFNPTTTIAYSLFETGNARLSVSDLCGRLVAVIEDRSRTQGEYTVVWDANANPAGIYLCRLTVTTASGFIYEQTRRMLLLK